MPQVNEFSWLFSSLKFLMLFFMTSVVINFFSNLSLSINLVGKKFSFNLMF